LQFSGRGSNGGFRSGKVEKCFVFQWGLTDTLSAILLKYNVNFVFGGGGDCGSREANLHSENC
jgi:hypothetical protein